MAHKPLRAWSEVVTISRTRSWVNQGIYDDALERQGNVQQCYETSGGSGVSGATCEPDLIQFRFNCDQSPRKCAEPREANRIVQRYFCLVNDEVSIPVLLSI
jgi:hypothetical protein